MHDLGPGSLQLLDDLHTGDELLFLLFEIVDLFNLVIELGDLCLQALVAIELFGHQRAYPQISAHRKHQRRHDRRGQADVKGQLALAALLFPPRQ